MTDTQAALVLAGGATSRMDTLGDRKAIAVLPFVGEHRIVDFTLWNAIDSGVHNVAVLASHCADSVRSYLSEHAPSVSVVQTDDGTYRGTADALRKGLGYAHAHHAEHPLVLSGSHVYQMDYRPFVEAHRDAGAGITVAIISAADANAHRFGVVELGDDGLIKGFADPTAEATSGLAPLGIYVVSTDYIEDLLERDADDPDSVHDLGYSLLPAAVREGRAYGYTFSGYWRCIDSVEEYHRAHMQYLHDPGLLPRIDAFQMLKLPGLRADPASYVSASATVRGVVTSSVIGPGTTVDRGAMVADSVLLGNAYVGKGAYVERAVLDEGAWLGEGAQIGVGQPWDPGRDGITVLGRGAVVPHRHRCLASCHASSEGLIKQYA